MRLVPKRKAFAAPQRDCKLARPFDEGQHGQVVTFDLDELSAHVLRIMPDVRGVSLVPLAWKLDPCGFHADAIQTIGRQENLATVKVPADPPPPPTKNKSAPGARERSSSTPATSSAASAVPGSSVDLLADLASFRSRAASAPTRPEPAAAPPDKVLKETQGRCLLEVMEDMTMSGKRDLTAMLDESDKLLQASGR